MEAEAFKAAVSAETAALGERPSVAEVRAAIARLESLDPPPTVTQWRSGLVLLEGMAAMGWPSGTPLSPDEQESLDAMLTGPTE